MLSEKQLADAKRRRDATDPFMRVMFVVACLAIVGILVIPVFFVYVPPTPNRSVLDPQPALARPTPDEIYSMSVAVAWFFCMLTALACGLAAVAYSEPAERRRNAPWQFCRNCDREILPYNPFLVITWTCPHCRKGQRHKSPKNKSEAKHARKDAEQPFPFLDPDF